MHLQKNSPSILQSLFQERGLGDQRSKGCVFQKASEAGWDNQDHSGKTDPGFPCGQTGWLSETDWNQKRLHFPQSVEYQMYTFQRALVKMNKFCYCWRKRSESLKERLKYSVSTTALELEGGVADPSNAMRRSNLHFSDIVLCLDVEIARAES